MTTREKEGETTDKGEWSSDFHIPGLDIPGLNLTRKAKRNLRRRQKRIELKEQEEEEKRNEDAAKNNKMTEYFIQKESNKVIETLTLAGATDETNLDEGWGGKIPAVCSTPKMTSIIGREIQEEYRRNSLSKKRKCSPEENKEKTEKQSLIPQEKKRK